MHEVRLTRPFMEGAIMLAMNNIESDDHDSMVKCWFKEQVDWCKERKLHVITHIDMENWLSPNANEASISAIVHEEIEWPGPDVCFIFPDDNDATLFRLTWG